MRVMAKLNPFAPALKKIRKVETEQRRKAKKASIEKAKALHKAMKEAKKKRKLAGKLDKKSARTKVAKVSKKTPGNAKK